MAEEKDILNEELLDEKEQEATVENNDASDEKSSDCQEEKSLEVLYKEAQEEIARLNDQLLRKIAEFENFRKRTIKEKTELILNGGQKVLESLLPVLDDLERAQLNIEKSDNVDTLKEGVDLIASKLLKTLSAQGLKKIETSDCTFDTDFHEAIALLPVEDEKKKNKIIDCVQTGYMLNDKVVRHAKVVVGQ